MLQSVYIIRYNIWFAKDWYIGTWIHIQTSRGSWWLQEPATVPQNLPNEGKRLAISQLSYVVRHNKSANPFFHGNVQTLLQNHSSLCWYFCQFGVPQVDCNNERIISNLQIILKSAQDHSHATLNLPSCSDTSIKVTLEHLHHIKFIFHEGTDTCKKYMQIHQAWFSTHLFPSRFTCGCLLFGELKQFRPKSEVHNTVCLYNIQHSCLYRLSHFHWPSHWRFNNSVQFQTLILFAVKYSLKEAAIDWT